jgi:hypothetical protein
MFDPSDMKRSLLFLFQPSNITFNLYLKLNYYPNTNNVFQNDYNINQLFHFHLNPITT